MTYTTPDDMLAELHRLADFHQRKSQYAKTVHALRQAAAEMESLRDEMAENEQLMVAFRSARNRAEDRAERAEVEVKRLRDEHTTALGVVRRMVSVIRDLGDEDRWELDTAEETLRDVAEALECLFDGGSVTIDAVTGRIVLATAEQLAVIAVDIDPDHRP